MSLNTAEVDQNIGLLPFVWRTRFEELREKCDHISSINHIQEQQLEANKKGLHTLVKVVREELYDARINRKTEDNFDSIGYAVELLGSKMSTTEQHLHDEVSNFMHVKKIICDIMQRNNLLKKEIEYYDWDWEDVEDKLAEIAKYIVITDVAVHGEESTTSTNDEKLKQNLHILGLPEDTDIYTDNGWKKVKQAYRRLALKNHPDKGGEEETFKKINEAYHWLENEHSKNVGEYVKSITSNSHARPMDLSTALHIFNTFMQSEARQERRATGNPYFIKPSM